MFPYWKRADVWAKLFVCLILLFSLAPFSAFAQQPSTASAISLQDGFEHPPEQARLRCYWWWLNGNITKATIKYDLEQMKAKGYGGALLVDANGSNQGGNANVPAGPMFGSPAWTQLYVYALKIAAQLHLEISLNITSGWNLGGPYVTPADASKLLTWSRTDVTGGRELQLKLPTPPSRNGFYRQVAVLAYPLRHGKPLPGQPGSGRQSIRQLSLKTASQEMGISMPDTTSLLTERPAVAGEQDTDLAAVRNISADVSTDGTLHWNAPAGLWEILWIGYTDSGARISTASGAWQGLDMDYLNHHAFDDYWKRTMVPLLQAGKPYIGRSLKYLVTDSWELGGTNWTEGFRVQFEKRRGYDPVPWLPVVAGRIVQSRDASNRFLNDLRRTVGDLIVAEHYDVFARDAREWGLGTHPESGGPHGAPMDALETFRSASFPQTEFWAKSKTHRSSEQDRFFVKEASSAAHIYGKHLVADEGPTSVGPQWSESLAANLKPTFDHALTEGMNRLVWHQFTASPAKFGLPGEEYFAGTHLNPNVTWWKQSNAFFLYLNRCQFMLQQGTPVEDLLYFYGNEVPNFARLKDADPAHVLPGYDYDVTDQDALMRTLRIHNGVLESPGGIRYRALAMPASGRMSLADLQRIAEYVREGGTAIGPKPASPTGLVSMQTTQQFRKLANGIWGNCSESLHRYGKGQAYCSSNAHEVLNRMGIPPDFQQSAGGPRLDFVHRIAGSTDIYFLRNGSAQTVDTRVTFRVIGKSPTLWNAVTGNIRKTLLFNEDRSAGTTSMPLHVAPYGSIFVVFEKAAPVYVTSLVLNGTPLNLQQGTANSMPDVMRCGATYCLTAAVSGDYAVTLSNNHKYQAQISITNPQQRLPGPWTMTFQKDRGGPESPITVSSLTDWDQSSNPAIRYFSGTVTYATSFSLPELPSSHQVYLRLGSLHEICTVIVNGKDAGTIWADPLKLDITRFLRAGTNQLQLKVTNLWPNRIIGDLQPGAKVRYTHTNIHKYTANSKLLPSGLSGNVTLQVKSCMHLSFR